MGIDWRTILAISVLASVVLISVFAPPDIARVVAAELLRILASIIVSYLTAIYVVRRVLRK